MSAEGIGLLKKAADLREHKIPFTAAVIVRKKGSSPRDEGAMMIVSGSGELLGTIGGGKIEYLAINRARELINEDIPAERVVYDLGTDNEDADVTGMVCGGELEVLFINDRVMNDSFFDETVSVNAGRKILFLDLSSSEPSLEILDREDVPERYVDKADRVYADEDVFMMPVGQDPRVFIVGAGHIGRALCPLMKSIGFRPVIADDRSELLNEDSFINAEELIHISWDALAEQLDMQNDDYVVVATNGHAHDEQALICALNKKPVYIGCIGSRKKAAYVRERLKERGFTDEEISGIHSPIGLNLGGRSPGEIAVSIAAEIIETRYGKNKKEVHSWI